MAEPGRNQQLTLGRELFLPGKTVQAMRDSRYRHAANAVSELIDNSIDANATHVDLLIQEQQELVNTRRRWKVGKLGIFDNGDGMSDARLVQALQFGGRGESNRIQRIGKYGMGLPTASVSQCRRVDLWTWQRSINSPSHSYIDVDLIELGDQIEIPQPDSTPIPTEWLSLVRPEACTGSSGTLVVWSSTDRIKAQAETIFDRVEKEIGRIYRHFIDDNEVNIRMAAFREGHTIPLENRDRTVRPNDPLFLMSNSSTSEPWRAEPMFNLSHQETFPVKVNGRQEAVEVTYSLVKQEALGSQRQTPGSLPHGQDARDNMGVSVVRENREILVDNSFVREGGRGSIPMNRWWGCEVRFNRNCDDLFGIDHNKQMVVTFSNAAKELLNSEDDTSAILRDLGVEEDPIYEIVADIRNTTRNMLGDIEGMFKRRRREREELDDETLHSDASPETEASRIATVSTNDMLQEQSESPTKTDRVHDELDKEAREDQIASFLAEEGFEGEEARRRAQQLVRNAFRYAFAAGDLSGFQMFNGRSRGGVLFVELNINHQLYKFLDFLEQDADENDNPVARRAAICIRTLLLAWSRMEDHIEDGERKQRVQQIASNWGEQANDVLRQLNEQSTEM